MPCKLIQERSIKLLIVSAVMLQQKIQFQEKHSVCSLEAHTPAQGSTFDCTPIALPVVSNAVQAATGPWRQTAKQG